jgi:hypothetical protein
MYYLNALLSLAETHPVYVRVHLFYDFHLHRWKLSLVLKVSTYSLCNVRVITYSLCYLRFITYSLCNVRFITYSLCYLWKLSLVLKVSTQCLKFSCLYVLHPI